MGSRPARQGGPLALGMAWPGCSNSCQQMPADNPVQLTSRLGFASPQNITFHPSCPSGPCRRQEAAARERQLAAQRAQHLPSLKQAHAATLPPARAASLRRLAARPVFPASAGLAAAVGQTTASISSLSGISTMQAGLESQQAFSPGALGGASAATRAQPGLPRLGSGRLGWREKREAEAARLVDQAYSHIKVRLARRSSVVWLPADAALSTSPARQAKLSQLAALYVDACRPPRPLAAGC